MPVTAGTVHDKDYEYDLHKRATALYPVCSSDGCELLRFGRTLSSRANPHPVNQSNRCATWIRVVFAEGREGSIDISNAAILKHFDADFSCFTSGTKIPLLRWHETQEASKVLGDMA